MTFIEITGAIHHPCAAPRWLRATARIRARLNGRRVIPDLAFAFRRGKPLGEFIMSELKLMNEGGNFQELDTDFKAWMASDKRMQKAAKCFDHE